MANHGRTILIFSFLVSADLATARDCSLKWNDPYLNGTIDYSIPCPYGTCLPLDITLPRNAGVLEYLCVMWGFMPFAVVAFGVLELLLGPCFVKLQMCFCCKDCARTRPNYYIGTRELSFVLFCVAALSLKFLLKHVINQRRPYESCCHTCGFPSGNSAMAFGLFCVMFLDGSYRIYSKEPKTLEEAGKESKDVPHEMLRRLTWIRFLSLLPFSSGDVMSNAEFVAFISFWAFVLLPTPVSRLVLNDHTVLQVGVGCFFGVFEAYFWFRITRRRQKKLNPRLGERICIFEHNFALPRNECVSRCFRLLAECGLQNMKDLPIDLERSKESVEKLANMCAEITWYEIWVIERMSRMLDFEQIAKAIGGKWAENTLLGSRIKSENSYLSMQRLKLEKLRKKLEELIPESDKPKKLKEKLEELRKKLKVEELRKRLEAKCPPESGKGLMNRISNLKDATTQLQELEASR